MTRSARSTRFLIIVSAATEVVLSLALVLLLRRLTKPIRDLEAATKEIASGVYDRRVTVRGKDEFHDLAEHFNKMAGNIEEHIAELDRTAQEKQNLVDNLAHELRTPLTAIRGYAEYLQNAHAREEDRIVASDYILSETRRMQNLAFKTARPRAAAQHPARHLCVSSDEAAQRGGGGDGAQARRKRGGAGAAVRA